MEFRSSDRGSQVNHPDDPIASQLSHAYDRWLNLLDELDKPEPNFETCQLASKETFETITGALAIAGKSPSHTEQSQKLFNAVIHDLYAFEPHASFAAHFIHDNPDASLARLLCLAVATSYPTDEPHAPRDQQVEEPSAFVSLSEWLTSALGKGAASLTGLTGFFAANPLWSIPWVAQRVRISVASATRSIRFDVLEPSGVRQFAVSKALDGWVVQVNALPAVKLRDGQAVLKLGEKLAALQIRVQNPATQEWVEFFAERTAKEG